VTWPAGGAVSCLKNIAVNQTIEIDERNAASSVSVPDKPANADKLFSETLDLINYTHEQADFIDFFLGQKIIPHKFSQIGPCMAKGDLNGDGREDLIIVPQIPHTMVFIEWQRIQRDHADRLNHP
jgi:hypothetical protein